MIKIRDFQGYEICYHTQLKRFELYEDGNVITFANTQDELEEKAKKLSKSEFKRIPILTVDSEGNVQLGELTSLNREEGGAWVVMEKSDRFGVGGGREKLRLYSQDSKFNEKTEANLAIIEAIEKKRDELKSITADIRALRGQLEKPINNAYFGIS